MRYPAIRKILGFTLVELVTVILLVSILSVMVLPRFVGPSAVSTSAARDVTISAARRAQQLAMNQGGGVVMSVDNSSKQITITHVGGDLNISLPQDVTITNASLSYDGLGSVTGTVLTISNGQTRQVCIESTGYAHAC